MMLECGELHISKPFCIDDALTRVIGLASIIGVLVRLLYAYLLPKVEE